MVADGDVVLALSYSGETDELINILPALARFDVRIIALTGNPKSFLAQNSHVHLDVSVEQEACPLNLAPTSSTTVMLVLGDALAMVLLEARGFTKEDFARYHPGGRLGRTLLLKVRQIMRGAEQMAVVTPAHASARGLAGDERAAARAPPSRWTMTADSPAFSRTAISRGISKRPAGIGDTPVEQFLTRHPITVRGDRLAAEVLHILETHRIDDLVVLDENDRAHRRRRFAGPRALPPRLSRGPPTGEDEAWFRGQARFEVELGSSGGRGRGTWGDAFCGRRHGGRAGLRCSGLRSGTMGGG